MELPALVRHLGSWSAGKGTLQQKLSNALKRSILQGLLNPGARMPSERALAQALMVSRTTVVASYAELRDSGWLRSRRGSGTRVSLDSGILQAERFAARAAELASGPLFGLLASQEVDSVIDFALGAPQPLTQLPPELFVIPPEEYSALLRDRLYHPLGIAPLRHAIAEFYSQTGLDTKADQILVTSGGQQAIALCVHLLVQRGDTVLVEDPAYFGALELMRSAGARMTSLPVGPDGVSPFAIRDRMKASAARLVYLTPTYQNPTGAVMPAEARKEIGRIAATTGTAVIDDCVMADLVAEGKPPSPLSAYAPNAPILTIGSLSKLVWPGLRVGWVRAAGPMVERLARLKSAIDLGCPQMTQTIAVRLLAATSESRRLRQQELRPRRDLLARLLKRHLPQWDFRVPTGGLFLWARIPSGDVRALAQVALRHGLVLLPGPVMSAEEGHRNFVRLPFFWEPETLRRGVDRLKAAWQEYQTAEQPERPGAVIV